ncbi:phosphohexomutase domain-containing protein [Litoreibacter arenae]|uniref:Phosphomannomutase n=1 Tax=Litoreibacter arenae DSM 19593 TaxID=1123360 RepID=S9QHX6_9RHOB|nr:phosphomannomutase/phosphoglucomutase [Litoreibacter arenae]EPX79437.1 Phosphomannomutase [Litoreibacter arenae DSM 19593]
MTTLTCFKSYDVRGRLGDELNEDICYGIGRGFARSIDPGSVVIGYDIRPTSQMLAGQLAEGLRDEGVDVISIGLCGTEEVYFATSHYDAGGGLMVTASHNPIDYNGIKMVRAGSRPISSADGLGEIQALVEAGDFGPAKKRGVLEHRDPRDAYAERVASFADVSTWRPMKAVVNAGNGVAGPAFDVIADKLKAPVEFIRQHHDPDGSFPNGIPNPLLEENRAQTAERVLSEGADLGIAWDGDFDRCFFFDETGAFIDGEYVVALLAGAFLEKHNGAKIIHDPRVIWALLDLVERGGGEAVVSKSGHSHIKAKMREVDAVYGGEMSAHHYFRDFMYCDSGMIPWILLVEHMSNSGKKLSELVADMQARFPSSGEINFKLDDKQPAIDAFEATYLPHAKAVDRLDGLSLDYGDWRVNLRQSNTEPVLRLNVEARGDRALLAAKVAEISALIRNAK